MGGHSGDNSCGISNKKARVCGLWDAPPIVVVVDWRLAADQLNTVCVCVCVSAGTPAQLHIACCRICTYASFQLSHCQPRCCSCCRFAGVAPANSGELSMQKTVNSKQCIGLTQQYFCTRQRWWYNKCTDLLNDVLQPCSTVRNPVS